MTWLLFDVGGTHLRAGLWDGGRLIARTCTDSHGEGSRDADPVANLVQLLVSIGRRVLGSKQARGIGLAFPGPVEPGGLVRQAPTLWGEALARPVPLAELVRVAFGGTPVHVINDVTAAGYRYAESLRDFCIVTVSSGIGNKVFLDGRPVIGREGRGGEIGHWQIDADPHAAQCECGGRGHLGAIASGRATRWHLETLAQTAPELFSRSCLGVDADNEQLVPAFHVHDPLARAVVARGADALASALALLHVGIGVESFVVFGGFARALGDDYLDELRRAASARTWGDPTRWRDRIVAAADDDDSGLVGLAMLLERRGGAA